MRTRAFVCMVLLPLVAACAEPLEFADWTVPVPEGTRVIGYADVATEDREDGVGLVEDLVIGPRGGDPNYLLFQPQGIAVDAAGSMYVVEVGGKRVQVFSAEGDYARTLGGEGQGPGELQMPMGLTFAGEQLVVHDWTNRRLSVWDLQGTHLGDAGLSGDLESRIFGTGSAFVGAMDRRLEDQSRLLDVARYSIEGTEALRYVSLPVPDQFQVLGEGGSMAFPRLAGGPSFTASAEGDVYATAGDQYQVLAFDPSGEMRWALRVARPARVFGQEQKDTVLDPLRDRFQDLASMELDWPAHLHVIGGLAVDGHGHLYVFPYIFRGMGPDDRPVEVYSRNGERLFAGTMREPDWSASQGDFVYTLRNNPQTEESELVRYRLVEPFD